MRPVTTPSIPLATAILMALALVSAAPLRAATAPERSHGELVAFDVEEGTVTVRQAAGPVVYHVALQGSAVTRTVATLDARPARLRDIPTGARVVVFWTPDPTQEDRRNARRIEARRPPPPEPPME